MEILEQLFVVWQDHESCRYFPVGHLEHIDDGKMPYYKFTYIEGASEALEHNFDPFMSFPDLKETYFSQELFPFFANRLLPRSRKDYAEFITSLGLVADEASPIEILARSGGRRATDSVELFSLPRNDSTLQGEKRFVSYFFLLHGLSHMKACAQDLAKDLKPGDSLFCMHDFQNPVDTEALALRTKKYCCVGFLPRYLLVDFWELVKMEDARITVAKVNPSPAPIQQRILCEFRATPTPGFQPCASELYKPYAGNKSTATHRPSLPM